MSDFERDLLAALADFPPNREGKRHWTNDFYYTAGVEFLADQAGAYWLLDLISSQQKRARKDRHLRSVQKWVLKRRGTEADLICYRENDEQEAWRVLIRHTAFPLEEITLFMEEGILCLPNER